VKPFDLKGRGLIWASTQDRNKGPFGLLRADGSWQVEPQYSYVQSLSDERAIVHVPNQPNFTNWSEFAKGQGWPQAAADQQGAVDPDGRLVVPLRPWHLGFWANGLGLVSECCEVFAQGKVGVIDKAGRILGDRLFDQVKRAETGDVSEVLLDGKWVGLDRAGRIVANPEDGKVVVQCPTGVKLVRQSGMVQVVGPDNQPTVPFLVQEPPGKVDCSQPLVVKSGSKWAYVGADGRLLGDPPFFDNVLFFADGYAGVMRNRKWGIIDTVGHFTVDLQYDDLRPTRKGVYAATKAGQKSWITATGVEQPQPAPEPVDSAVFRKCGPDGATIISNRDLSGTVTWGLADASGHEIIKPVHRAVHCFKNGVAWVPVDAKRQWCPVDPEGAMSDRPDCIPARYPFSQTHSYPEHFADDPYENSVRWTQALLEFGAGLRATRPQWILQGNTRTYSVSGWP
jgi:hypothetical protein